MHVGLDQLETIDNFTAALEDLRRAYAMPEMIAVFRPRSGSAVLCYRAEDGGETNQFAALTHVIDYSLRAAADGDLTVYGQVRELLAALKQAVRVIEQWHGTPVFDIYYSRSPEMKLIREALRSDARTQAKEG